MNDLLSLSTIAFMPPFPDAAPPDQVGELMFLDLRDLFIDPKYQRPIGERGEKNIRQVIENFSWSLFSPLVVCRRERGRYAIIDGQHRAIAALTHGGIKKVPCLVISGTPADEAKAFAVINGAVTAILPTQIWHARVMAGDYEALLLNRLFIAEGITVIKYQKPEAKMEVGELFSIDAFEKSFKRYGREAFTLAIRTILKTGHGNPGYLRSPIIKATCMVLAANPKWRANEAGVLRAIRTCGVKYLWGVAQARQKDKNITIVNAYVDALTYVLKKELG